MRLPVLALLGVMSSGCPSAVGSSGGAGAGGSNAGGGGTGGIGGSNTGGNGGSGGAKCQPEQEICDGKDNDCDDQIDNVTTPAEGCACSDGETQPCYSGEPATAGVGACHEGSQVCAGGTWGECTGQVVPGDEKCNLQDDDCNGSADDMGELSCGVGECAKTVTACVDGVAQACNPGQPSIEVCDGKDNNCNQLTDESDPMQDMTCNTGSLGLCATGKNKCVGMALKCVANIMPTPEVCDGTDNDCDGTPDNVPGSGGVCATGALGVCSPGVISCAQAGGSWGIDCVQVVTASAEACDGLDNDCDGQNDEGDPGGGGACNTGVPGICAEGVLHCVNGAVQCVANLTAKPETCNGLDDNCDGQGDEGNPGGGVGCATGLPGICATGTTSCSNGAIACNQTVQPMAESCNSQDDSCNGQVDEGNPGGGAACTTGLLGACAGGTITCQSGQLSCKQNVLASAEICGNAVDENCDGVATQAPTTYFSESFANNAAGWTLDSEWQIAPAVAGCSDPGTDTTPTADNGVAGVVIGNCSTSSVSKTVHGYYYLTSPIINTASAPSVFLSFKRWLTSDYTPYMNNVIEVYNGSAWTMIWQSGPSPGISDGAWQTISHDLSAYKNANMRIRWGFNIGSTGVFNEGSWNIDDVTVTNAVCN